MRIHSVSMQGFGPYAGTEMVDFDAFADDGLFLITGKTGSGKTSILDAICFALFGSIPRYDGTAGGKVRSDYIGDDEVSRVELEFSTGEGRYRIRREPEHHPEHRKTPIQQKAEIARVDGDGEEVLDTQVRNVGHRVAEIVGLSAEQFLQVILLAQGKFQEFLVADSGKRRDLLRTLFKTRRFDDYTTELADRARKLREQLTTSSTVITENLESLAQTVGREIADSVDVGSGASVLAWAEPIREEQRESVAAAAVKAEHAADAFKRADSALKTAEKVHELQERRDSARARKSALEAEAEAVAVAGESLKAARKAELAWQRVESSRAAQDVNDAAASVHGDALAALQAAHPDDSTSVTDLNAQVDALTRQAGELGGARDLEEQLPDLERAAQETATDLADFDGATAALPTERKELHEQLTALETDAEALSQKADQLSSAQQEYDALARRLDAAHRAERTAAEIEAAKQLQLTAGRALEAALAARNDLLERRLGGYAGELAEALAGGEPCPVCGSTSHPHPAALAEDYPTEADLEAAEEKAKETDVEAKRADDKVARLTTRWETETEEAGAPVVELETECATAKAALEAVRKAAGELKKVAAEQDRLRLAIEGKTEAIEAAQARRTVLSSAMTLAAKQAKDAITKVTHARADHPSVAARIDAIETHLGLARDLREATTSLESSVTDLKKAGAALADALAQHGFADAAHVEQARLTTGEQSALERRVRDHETGLRSVTETLADPAMKDLPEEPVDLTTPQQAAGAADALAKETNDVHVTLKATLATVERLVSRIGEATHQSAQLRARYEVVNGLAAAVRGQGSNTLKMWLETFVLTAELEEIVAAANTRLTKMSQGRYELLHTDEVGRGQSGLSLSVLDAHTGQGRPPESLSGGEKFQASLALALGLAEVVTSRNGGLRLETLFIDEGFGSLDSDTLETTMATLDSLREGGRTVGLISHVESMKETIPSKLYVDVVEGGGSTIRTG